MARARRGEGVGHVVAERWGRGAEAVGGVQHQGTPPWVKSMHSFRDRFTLRNGVDVLTCVRWNRIGIAAYVGGERRRRGHGPGRRRRTRATGFWFASRVLNGSLIHHCGVMQFLISISRQGCISRSLPRSSTRRRKLVGLFSFFATSRYILAEFRVSHVHWLPYRY